MPEKQEGRPSCFTGGSTVLRSTKCCRRAKQELRSVFDQGMVTLAENRRTVEQ